MYCRKCGSHMHDDAHFCSQCSAEVIAEVTQPVPNKPKRKVSKKLLLTIVAMVSASVLCVLLVCSIIKTPKERTVEALTKAQEATQIDMLIESDIQISYNGGSFSLNQTNIVMTDTTNSSNPLCAMQIITRDESGMLLPNELVTNCYYKDGYSYGKTFGSSGIKIAFDYEEFQGEFIRLQNRLLSKAEDMIDDIIIEERENGELFLSIPIDGRDFTQLIQSLCTTWLGETDLTIMDSPYCSMSAAVNSDNDIYEAKLFYEFTADIYGEFCTIVLNTTYFYNPIDEYFEISFPDDLDTYLETQS